MQLSKWKRGAVYALEIKPYIRRTTRFFFQNISFKVVSDVNPHRKTLKKNKVVLANILVNHYGIVTP